MANIENMSHFMFTCPKTNTNRERFYDNVMQIIIIHYVNLNVTDDETITFVLSDHRIMKITDSFIIKCMEGRCMLRCIFKHQLTL